MPFALYLKKPRLIVLAGAMIAAIVMTWSGGTAPVERLIDPLRAAAWLRPASGQVVVVEMDAASVAAIHQWPWARDHYAAVVDKLREAGAGSITFDVDLSSPSTPAGDAALAKALARADGLVALPTFGQQARLDDRRSIDALPIAMLRDHAALASVSMQPDPDGVVRRAPFGTITDGVPRPSLSSYMAHRSGQADDFFPIDFGIDPGTLPRLSFIAVRDGQFDPAKVRGKDVIIGATAIEMGDRYATPYWGVIPGVIVQAMAAETLGRGVPVEGSVLTVLLVAGVIGAGVLSLGGAMGPLAAILAPVALFVAGVAVQVTWGRVYPLAPGLILLLLVAAGLAAIKFLHRIERERSVDADTGLPNKRVMAADLAGSVDGQVVVALIGNFDNLLTICGDRAGHDLVLRLADRLRFGGQVYRLGDRLLGLLLPGDVDLDEHVAGLSAILRQPVEIAGRLVDAAVHLGVVTGGADSDRLSRATRAANRAATDNVFARHDQVDMDAVERELILMGELDEAIAAGQIEVHYQPKLDIAADRIASCEALVRWRHPTRGMVRPDLFIPLAEQADRIGPLTLFVLDRVVDDLQSWRAGGLELTAEVNVSAKLVASASFAAKVRDVIESGRVRPEWLILEVTESATLAEPERAAAVLGEWRAMGVSVSMDDYGTGQSTLSYLRQLPLSELKIDRSFVQHAHQNRADALMVRSTIDLAHELGIKVVAEGIEEEACLAFLRGVGCDMAQGYHIGRPMTATDFVRRLTNTSLAA